MATEQLHGPTTRVCLDVGGTRLSTSRATLTSERARGSKLEAMFSARHVLEDGHVFIDHDGTTMPTILDWLRHGTLSDSLDEQYVTRLRQDADFFLLNQLQETISAVYGHTATMVSDPAPDADALVGVKALPRLPPSHFQLVYSSLPVEGRRAPSLILSGLDLRDIWFVSLDLRRFETVDFSYSRFKIGTTFSGTLFNSNIRFTQAFLIGANLSGAKFHNANLNGANLIGADLSNAKIVQVNLCGANLTDANLCEANLSGANLTDANFTGANLSGARLYMAKLSGANLIGADLSDANLNRADLSGANLCEADLSGANLTDANFTGANFSGANLRGADLRGADLRGADLRFADLTNAKTDENENVEEASD